MSTELVANFKNTTDAAAKAEAARLNALGEIKKLRDGLIKEEFELRSEAELLERKYEMYLQSARKRDAEIVAGAEERLEATAVILKGKKYVDPREVPVEQIEAMLVIMDGDSLRQKKTADEQNAQKMFEKLEAANKHLLEKREALNAVFAGDPEEN